MDLSKLLIRAQRLQGAQLGVSSEIHTGAKLSRCVIAGLGANGENFLSLAVRLTQMDLSKLVILDLGFRGTAGCSTLNPHKS